MDVVMRAPADRAPRTRVPAERWQTKRMCAASVLHTHTQVRIAPRSCFGSDSQGE